MQDSVSKQTAVHSWDSFAEKSLRIFGYQVLLFPLLVVVVACTTFLFGGRCAPWQWWMTVAVVVVAPFLKKHGWRESLGAFGLFSGLLLVLKGMLPPMTWDNAVCVDMNMYHLPTIQLLIEGWNPVTDPLAERICASLGLDLWGMAPTLVAFYSKSMDVFAAVAYQFVKDPTGLTIPGLSFLWLGVFLQLFHQFRGMVRWAVMAALVWILPMVALRMYVDLSLAFASCGLLFAMEDALHRRCFDWVRLGVWTIWMATIKLNGVLAVIVFWGLFIATMFLRDRERRLLQLLHFALMGIAVACLSAIVAWNPYVTSWRTYGHPLYPFKTANADKFPPADPTWEQRLVNDDYRALGKTGLWLFYYVSPKLAIKVWEHFTENELLNPQSKWFSGQYISNSLRPWLWILFVVLLSHPRGRRWGLGGLLLTVFVPWEKIGYPRYEPWLSGLGCLAIALLTERYFAHCNRWRNTVFVGFLGCIMVVTSGPWILQTARRVDFKAKELGVARARIHCNFWAPNRDPKDGVNPMDFVPRFSWLTMLENQCHLFVKEMGWDAHATVLSALGWVPAKQYPWQIRRPLWKWDERQWFAPEEERDERFPEDLGEPWQGLDPWKGPFNPESDVETWVMTPWRYWVPVDEQSKHVLDYFTKTQMRADESRGAWLKRLLLFSTKTWFVTYPQEVWKWLVGRGREMSN